MEDDVVIRIRGMKKSYTIIDPSLGLSRLHTKKKTVYPIFDGIDLDVKKGDIVGILGRNGCGKSTFLKLVSEILEPDEGTIEVKGKVASILELSMGFHGDMSGRDNIILRSELYGIEREHVIEHLEKIIEYSDLGVFIDNPVRTYSSGMRSRLAFAIMVNVDADIFLVDEALSTGDMAFASKASEHLKNLVRSGKTVLFTSHSMNTIKRTCNRAIWLSDRVIKMDGPAEEVVDAYSRSINDSFEETLHLANDGSSSAQYRVSTFYRDGNGVEKNEEERRRWLNEAALRDHPMALNDLADIMMSEGKTEEAMEMYQKAAEAGNYEARRKFASLQGETLDEIRELRQVLKGFCSSEYPYDYYNYGNMMFKSALTINDYKEAMEYLQKASEMGWSDADVLIGQMYRDGNGVERDIDKCIHYLSKAANNGHNKAMAMLGDLFYDNKVTKKNPEEAFKWYMMSASVGNAKSQYQVAMMLDEGIGVEKDEDGAKMWFARYSSSMVNDSRKIALDILKARRGDMTTSNDILKAMSRSNHPNSMMTLAGKYQTGRGFKKNEKAAMDLMRKAAVAGGQPRTKLADMIANANKSEGYPQEAFDLVKSACEFGDAGAMYKMAQFYKDGIIVEENVDMYRKYMKMAAERGNRDAKMTVMKWEQRTERRKNDKEKSQSAKNDGKGAPKKGASKGPFKPRTNKGPSKSNRNQGPPKNNPKTK